MSELFDLRQSDFLTDPYTTTARLREQGALVRARYFEGSQVWLVTRDAEVRTVLSDPRFVVDPASVPDGRAPATRRSALRNMGIEDDLIPYLTEAILDRDPPDHTRLRRLVSRVFTMRRVTGLRSQVEEISEKLLAQLAACGEDGLVDLIEHFAYPMPITVVCALVGVPESDRHHWLKWSHDLMSEEPGAMRSSLCDMAAQTRTMIAECRSSPGGELLDALVEAHDSEGGRLTETELITMILSLVVAGHETTAHLIANGTVALLSHPRQLAALRANPALLPAAVHEIQRWGGPIVHGRLRYARENLTLGGMSVAAGDPVMALLVSANHDPLRHPDPERFDILRRRPEDRSEEHVGFGHGTHYCLGAALARQEAEVAFGTLLACYPDLSLGVSEAELEWLPRLGFRRLARLPVRLSTP
jgi:cytochrome P450